MRINHPPPPLFNARGPPPPPPPPAGRFGARPPLPPMLNGRGIPHHVPQHSVHPSLPPHPHFSSGPFPNTAVVVSPLPTAPTTTTTTTTPAPIPTATSPWTEYTDPNGKTFYYNSITKTSIYDKPPELGGPVKTTTNTGQWVEYTDAATGKKYYSNGTTVTWDKPGTTTTATTTATTNNTTTTTTNTENTNTDSPPRKKPKTKPRETEFSSKEEAIAAFKGLLIAKDVPPSLKWNELTKLYSTDTRWEACQEVLTNGERKQALAEYQTKRANELRMLERQEKARAREAFGELLTDTLPKLHDFSAWNTRFEDIRDLLAKDDRFHAVAEEATRERLFLDFCEEFRKREERKKRSVRREAQDSFISFLQEQEEAGSLTFASTWNSFLSALDETAKLDTRFLTSPVMTDSDRQLYFADFVIELQAVEDDKRRRIRDAHRRAEQAQRDAYRDFLEKFPAGKFSNLAAQRRE